MNGLRKIKKLFILGIVNLLLKGTHFFSLKRKLLNLCEGIKIGQGTRIVTPINIPWWSVLDIGECCWIGRDFTLEGNGEVYIGNNCDLGPNVICVTGSHDIGGVERRAGKGFNGIISVGNATWIGTRTILLPNIRIGNGSIVGAASVVTKDVLDNGVYAGNPAKKIRDL